MEAIPTPYRPPASSQPAHTPSYLPDSHTLGGSLRTQPTASPSLSSSDCRATAPPRRQSFDPSSSYTMSQPYGKSTLVAPTSSSRDALASSPPPTDSIDQYASYGLDSNSLPLTRTSFSSQYANSSSSGHLASSSQRQTPAVASYHDRAPPSSSLAPPPHRSFSSRYSQQHLHPSSSSSSTYPPQRQPLNDYSVLQNASSSHLSSSHRYSRIFTDEELALQPSQEGRRWSDPRESVGGVVYPSLIRKRRRRTTPQELSILEAYFAKNALPCHEEREAIASELSMTARHVQIWFQNKRQTEKKKSNPSSSSQQTSTSPNPDDLSLPQSSTYTDHAEDEDDEDRSDRPSLLHRSSSATESGSDTLYEDEASMPSLSFSSSSSGSLISIPELSQSVPPPPLPPILEALVTSKADADPTPRPRRLHQTGSFESSSSAISPNFSADRSELPLLPSTPSAFRTSISKSTSDSNVARTSRLGKTPSAGRSMMDEVVQSRELPFNQSSQKKRRRSVVDEGGRNKVSDKIVQNQETDGKDVWKAMVSDPLSTDDLAPPAEDDGDKTDTERPISSQRVTTSSQGHQRHLSSSSTSSLLPPISKTKPAFRTPAKTPYASLHQALSLPSLHRTQQPTSFQSSTTTSACSTTRTAIPSRLSSSSRRSASLDHVASRPPGSSSHAHSQPSSSQTSITSSSTYISSNHSVTSSHSQDSNGSMTSGRTTGGGGGGQKRTRIAMGKSGSMDQVIGGSSSKAGDRSERKRKMGKSSGSGRKSIGAEGGKDGSRRRWSKAGIIDDKAVKAGEEANKMEERKAVGERMKARSGLLDRALASPAPASSSVLINALPPQPSADTARSPPPPPPPAPPPHSTQPKAPTAAEDDQECAMLLLGLLGGGR